MAALSHPSSITVRNVGDLTVVKFADRELLDDQSIKEFADHISKLIAERGRRFVIIDFNVVQRIASLGVGKLIRLRREIDSAGGRLVLCRLRPHVKEVFETLHILSMFPIYDSEAEALASF